VFRLFDDDRTSFITISNLRRVARELGETMDDTELQEMIERADTTGDGKVTFEDFFGIMTKKTFAWDYPLERVYILFQLTTRILFITI